MKNNGFYVLKWLYNLWQNFLRRKCFYTLKISPKDNMAKDVFYHSPLVGYSFLSSAYKTSSTRNVLIGENNAGSCNSVQITTSAVEFIYEHPLARRKHQSHFSYWPHPNPSGFYVLQQPVEKLLFDILKNLVTFTASNHCMYGGKRYN